MNRLSPEGRWLRLGLAFATLLMMLGLALARSGCRPPLFPCGFHAVSGLPCLFCGGTRAVSAVLHGNLPMAFYLNALAFPVLALVAMILVGLLVEAATGRPIAPWETYFRRLGRVAPVLILPALAWWMFHIYLALTTPKPELVDFRNPVAAKAKMLVEQAGR
ncbi:MAG: DUF2752 domain-containing protein [Terrimicrobiaceae bacterium]|nr:DUF2752 domain-containing protein [Terrimicrobiaceae bacterium]